MRTLHGRSSKLEVMSLFAHVDHIYLYIVPQVDSVGKAFSHGELKIWVSEGLWFCHPANGDSNGSLPRYRTKWSEY